MHRLLCLQERFYFGDGVLPLFESGIPLLLDRLKRLPDKDKVGRWDQGCSIASMAAIPELWTMQLQSYSALLKPMVLSRTEGLRAAVFRATTPSHVLVVDTQQRWPQVQEGMRWTPDSGQRWSRDMVLTCACRLPPR